MNKSQATEIIPGLFIGNRKAAMNNRFFKQNNITVVINCTKDQSFLRANDNIKRSQIRLAVDDDLSTVEIHKLYKYLMNITELIHKHMMNFKGVLVHCYAGIQRSATVVAAYLMRYGNIDQKKAIELIKSKRTICFTPFVNFTKALELFEIKLKNL